MRKNKARERELPDIQTGSFHSHYCIFKRQVLTAHFCSARKEGWFFFFFFLLVCLKSVHECFFSYFSRWTNRWDTTATWNVRGGRWRLRLLGRAIPDSPHRSVHATSLTCVCELDGMGTLGRAGDRC